MPFLITRHFALGVAQVAETTTCTVAPLCGTCCWVAHNQLPCSNAPVRDIFQISCTDHSLRRKKCTRTKYNQRRETSKKKINTSICPSFQCPPSYKLSIIHSAQLFCLYLFCSGNNLVDGFERLLQRSWLLHFQETKAKHRTGAKRGFWRFCSANDFKEERNRMNDLSL